MASFRTFEDMPVWQNARRFAAEADKLVENSKIRFSFKLRDQMLGSSGSIMDNIAEGFERNGNKEFIKFLYYSKGSAGEFKSQLYRALDAGRITQDEFNAIKPKVEAIGTELGNFLKYLHATDKTGIRYNRKTKKD